MVPVEPTAGGVTAAAVHGRRGRHCRRHCPGGARQQASRSRWPWKAGRLCGARRGWRRRWRAGWRGGGRRGRCSAGRAPRTGWSWPRLWSWLGRGGSRCRGLPPRDGAVFRRGRTSDSQRQNEMRYRPARLYTWAVPVCRASCVGLVQTAPASSWRLVI
jgi:hypothetical protein